MSILPDLQRVTAEQLANIPDDGQRRELIHGVLKMMSPAGGRHGSVAFRLSRLLGNHVLPARLGEVFAAETGFILARDPDTVRAPDVAFVRQERMDALQDISGFLPLAPDLVAEVISPNDVFSHVEEKALFWLKNGVQIVLIVDPENRTLRVCRPEQMQLLDETKELVIDELLPDWRMRVGELFA